MNTIGIMQPYFFPYIGYWQLIRAVDRFVIYDNIQYTKKGWINRNHFLHHDRKMLFSINVERAGADLDVCERSISLEYRREKLIARLQSAYRKAPMFDKAFDTIEQAIRFPSQNLFEYIYNSVLQICTYLGIDTEIMVSSTLNTESTLKSERRVIAICKELGGHIYINAIGGQALYLRESFEKENIALQFIKTRPVEYPQWGGKFVPSLSIIDLMMFCSKEELSEILKEYDLLDGV